MDRHEKLRRVALKCGDFARQLSYHLALDRCRNDKLTLNFWICMYNNAIDLAILDWSHLFGNHKDNLHWKRVVQDEEEFKKGLLAELGIGEEEWNSYHERVKDYRDKDVAHIEVRPVSSVPKMDIALNATSYYYKYILPELVGYSDCYCKYPKDLIEFHEKSLEQAIRITSIAYGATKNIEEDVY